MDVSPDNKRYATDLHIATDPLHVMASDKGIPQAVISYETALAIHDLSDVNPSRIHLTVPPRSRKQMPSAIVLHCAILPDIDREHRVGYDVTTPTRTLLDIAASPQSWVFLEGAVRDALKQGMIRRSQIPLMSQDGEIRSRLQDAVEASEGRKMGA